MPVALLLHKVLSTLRAAATALTPWREIVPLESTIVERARSAFLVHWFGPRLPFEGLSLRAHIVNVDELAGRYRLAQRSVPSSAGGPNLTEPVLGFAGLLSGVMLSPAGAATGVYLLLRFADFSLKTLGLALAWLAVPSLLAVGLVLAPAGTSILFAGLVGGAAGGYALAGGLGDRRDLRALFNLFGALARFMNATVVFLDQLTGPRSEVRNPLLRQILKVADRLAAVLAHGLGAVAVLVRRIGPVLAPVARVLVALGGLVSAMSATLGEVVRGFAERPGELVREHSLEEIVGRVTTVATTQLERIDAVLTEELDAIATAFRELGSRLGAAFDAFGAAVGNFLKRLFDRHHVIRVFDALAEQMDLIKAAWAATPAAASTGPSIIAPLVTAITAPLAAPIAALPSFPPLPTLPDEAQRERIRQELGVETVPELSIEAIEAAAARLGRAPGPSARLELSPEARTALDRALRRPSVFAPERRALELRLGRPPAEALALNREDLAQFREALSVVVGRVLPPEMRAVYAPQLAETLAAIDRRLYGLEAAAPRELPVLDLPTSDRLRPEVRLLRLRMPGAHMNDVKRFQDLVVERLRRQTYTAVSPAPVPAGAP